MHKAVTPLIKDLQYKTILCVVFLCFVFSVTILESQDEIIKNKFKTLEIFKLV